MERGRERGEKKILRRRTREKGGRNGSRRESEERYEGDEGRGGESRGRRECGGEKMREVRKRREGN